MSRLAIPALGLTGLLLMLEVTIGLELGSIIEQAEARVGRPGSPTSVAGVSRRTTRRRARRRVTVLPAGCTTVVTRGVTYHRCGTVYYRPYYEGNALVYEEVDAP